MVVFRCAVMQDRRCAGMLQHARISSAPSAICKWHFCHFAWGACPTLSLPCPSRTIFRQTREAANLQRVVQELSESRKQAVMKAARWVGDGGAAGPQPPVASMPCWPNRRVVRLGLAMQRQPSLSYLLSYLLSWPAPPTAAFPPLPASCSSLSERYSELQAEYHRSLRIADLSRCVRCGLGAC